MILKGTVWNSGPEGRRLDAPARESRDKDTRDRLFIDSILPVAGELQPASLHLAASDGHGNSHVHVHSHGNCKPVTGTFDHGDPANHAYTPLTRRAASP